MRSLRLFRPIDFEKAWQAIPGSEATMSSPARARYRFYIESYPIIAKHFAQCRFDKSLEDFERVRVAMILVYSWMGRGILKNFKEQSQFYAKACTAILSARSNGYLDDTSLQSIKDLCNNSLVAASKFLHFVNPRCFAIWDRRVANATLCVSYERIVENPRQFLAYLKWIRAAEVAPSIVRDVSRFLAIEPDSAELRVKEFLLFMMGGKNEG